MDFPDGCPVCGGVNNGRGTCVPCTRTVSTFRELIRNLQNWRSAHESDANLDVLSSADGREWMLWDVEQFYDARRLLPEQQRTCIELFLYENHFERTTAEKMGVGRDSKHTSVAIYATVGLIKLLSLARAGQIPGCHFEFDVDMAEPEPKPIPAVEPAVQINIIDRAPAPVITVQVSYQSDGNDVVVKYPLFSELVSP
jgi:hypothetical protein